MVQNSGKTLSRTCGTYHFEQMVPDSGKRVPELYFGKDPNPDLTSSFKWCRTRVRGVPELFSVRIHIRILSVQPDGAELMYQNFFRKGSKSGSYQWWCRVRGGPELIFRNVPNLDLSSSARLCRTWVKRLSRTCQVRIQIQILPVWPDIAKLG